MAKTDEETLEAEETENEIIVAGKELHEIISAAKELGIKLTNAKPGSELWEQVWGDPAKHAELCIDDGHTDECKAAIEDPAIEDPPPMCDLRGCEGAPFAAFSEQVWCGAVRELLESV